MHILRPPFRMDEAAALDFAARRGFGLVAAAGDDPIGSHVPFVIEQRDGPPIVQFHLTAKNPLVARAAAGARFLIAVAGADSYVSNDWYVSKDQVSTWLYEAVHLSGVAQLRSLGDNRPHGDALLEVSEARLPKMPWTLAEMEPTKRQAMLDMIRVVDVHVDRIEGQSKLNHHKPDADHVAIANALARGNAAARELATKMRALRPHLSYDFPADVF
jgi:transcriptional regulator